ncbi:MAG TPA: hypothetical protein VMV97_12145 [Sulfuriferula sp.]|nr:hypothetical protein [Sulfuriferula sp.]
MKAQFTRVSPAAFLEKIGIPAGWFVISHRWMPEKSNRRLSHGRWFKIKSTHGEVFRILRFSASLEGSPKAGSGQIVIDWPGWLDLFGRADDVDGPIELEFSEARWWQFPRLAVSHPDPTIRLSGLLGLLSVVLGVLSAILALVAL